MRDRTQKRWAVMKSRRDERANKLENATLINENVILIYAKY